MPISSLPHIIKRYGYEMQEALKGLPYPVPSFLFCSGHLTGTSARGWAGMLYLSLALTLQESGAAEARNAEAVKAKLSRTHYESDLQR